MDARSDRMALAAARAGSFRSAAKALGLDAATVSRTVRSLEDQLGVSLFERLPNGLRPTAAGTAYLAEAARLVEDLDRLADRAAAAGRGETGSLRLGFLWSFASGPAARLIAAFRAAHPQVTLSLTEAGATGLAAALTAERLDLILIAQATAPTDAGPLRRQPLWRERLMVVAPLDAGPGPTTSWADLAGRPLLCRLDDPAAAFSAYVAGLGGPVLDFRPQDCALTSLPGLVAAGLGWAVLPESATEGLGPGLKATHLAGDSAVMTVTALWRPETDNPVLVRFLALARRLSRPGSDPG
ncbi:hypothetical protein BZG35_08590 [Brevundimonas sp. LM2]|uniref:LysR family transcriptional regulator n=1 Tax=Brevundimonas sp. LM2 TaxID=1938605 RepID=UPI000983E72D|nr:LysR family transcriptional regulator [Brevundimonas sp. LM2]AQR61703.1 hypothetical protein BZG35_08590 [Brevundimonas sp. LM2]